MKCPCKDCLCVPMCSQKPYGELIKCSLISEYLIDPCYTKERPTNRVIETFRLLQPAIWMYEIRSNGNIIFEPTKLGEVPESG